MFLFTLPVHINCFLFACYYICTRSLEIFYGINSMLSSIGLTLLEVFKINAAHSSQSTYYVNGVSQDFCLFEFFPYCTLLQLLIKILKISAFTNSLL